MEDIRTRLEERKGWWMEERATIPCAVTKDGLLVKFRLTDVEATMNEAYTRHKRGWYFNATKDREVAKIEGEYVIANPSVLWCHFLRQI